jgi:ribonuclease Z
MSFSVLILGSGSALPTISSNQTAQIVEAENSLFLVDCGEGTQIELRRNKVKVQKIDQIFISHLHGDHFYGLVGLLSTMHLLGRKKVLQIHGPVGLEEIIQIQFRNAGSFLSYDMEFNEIEKAGQLLYEDTKISVTSLPLKHRIPCFGFLFQEKKKLKRLLPKALVEYKIPNYARRSIAEGNDFRTENGVVIPNKYITKEPQPPKSYAYCSDTAYYEKLLDYIEGVNLIYHESTFLEKDKERAKKTFHSTAANAANIALKANAGSLLLGHFSNRYKNKDGFLQEARPIFRNTNIAEEGKVFNV